ncbi:CHAD domain-containing protein [Roseiarcaceae bacterium H3SJ34-1]|uniref:CHAD domain-containing protein n=1 Tax=Terripilifer ovatus TaxID=3032367 RepID=UPI003AB954A5|nr:CHAD domain-containing protein [Roseiarcaceae bacterium H3SJ34-1]
MASISKHRNAATRLCRAKFLRLMGDTAKRIVDEKIPIAKRVHDVRRAAKEGRALLKLMPPLYGDEARAQRSILRDVRRKFGSARDSRVALSLVSGQDKADNPAPRAALRKLEHHCHAEEAALTPQILSRAAAQFTAVADIAKIWAIRPDSDLDIVAQATKCYRQARQLLPTGKERSFKLLHEFRSAVVDHHHQISLLEECDGRKPNRRTKKLQQLRASLGDCIDLEGVERLLHNGADQEAKYANVHLKHRKKARLAEAVQAAHTLFREKPREFATHLNR